MAEWNGGCTLSMDLGAPTVTDASHVISPHSDCHDSWMPKVSSLV